jgi:hypothetical protein
MRAYTGVASVLLLCLASAIAVDVQSSRKSIVTSNTPITYAATTRIVNDLTAPDPNAAPEAPRDIVFSDETGNEDNMPHQKVKRTPSHALHQRVSMPAAAETGITPIHPKKAVWNDEEIQRETIARVTSGIPQLLAKVDTDMHRLREKTLMDGVVNFIQTSEKDMLTEKSRSKESPSTMLRRMKRQLEDLDRRRSKLESVRDAIKEELATKKTTVYHAPYHRSRSHSASPTILVEASSVKETAPLDGSSLDLDVKDWADQARFKQQKNDIDNVLADADTALTRMSARVKLDYEQ